MNDSTSTALLDLFDSKSNKPLHPLSEQELAAAVGTNALGQVGAAIAPAANGHLGTPVNFNPHDIGHMVMRIDPMPGGKDVRVTVAELRDMARNQNKVVPQLVKASTAKPSTAAAGHPVTFEATATGQLQAVKELPAPTVPVEPVVDTPVPVPAVTPMQALKQSKAVMKAPAVEKPVTLQVDAPTNEVLFEVQNVGVFNGLYHDVIIGASFITLVFDLRWKAGKFFPNTDAPIAMQIVGVDRVFLVHTTGVQFSHGDYEFCILLIAEQN